MQQSSVLAANVSRSYRVQLCAFSAPCSNVFVLKYVLQAPIGDYLEGRLLKAGYAGVMLALLLPSIRAEVPTLGVKTPRFRVQGGSSFGEKVWRLKRISLN